MTAPDLAEYALLATRISAAYPSYRIQEATLVDWTERLAEVDDLEHATRMANRLRNLPSPPDPRDWQIARRDTREVEYVRALPAGPVVDDRTPEEKERWEALKAKLREKPIGRSFPAALLEVPDSELDTPSIAPSQRMCPGVAEGFGIRNGRHLLCKLCRDDLCPDCIPTPRAERNCVALKERFDLFPLPDSSSSSEKGVR